MIIILEYLLYADAFSFVYAVFYVGCSNPSARYPIWLFLWYVNTISRIILKVAIILIPSCSLLFGSIFNVIRWVIGILLFPYRWWNPLSHRFLLVILIFIQPVKFEGRYVLIWFPTTLRIEAAVVGINVVLIGILL